MNGSFFHGRQYGQHLDLLRDFIGPIIGNKGQSFGLAAPSGAALFLNSLELKKQSLLTVYDDKQRIVSTVEKLLDDTIISGFEYEYDEIGRISSEKVLAKNEKMCYTYDEQSRVVKRTVICLSGSTETEETFSYDAAGNVTADNSHAFVYDVNNRLTEYDGNAVTYDEDGNMLSATLNGEESAFSFDSSNRLTSAGGHIYTYDAENVRIRNLCADADTAYVYNTNCKLSQLLMKSTNGITTKYVYGLGLIGEEKCGEFKTYHFDYRGSTVAITDANSTITDTFVYDTYGKLISRTGSSFVIFGYNGRDGVVTDKNGLIYMRARYYSPELRRFINADIVSGSIDNSVTLNRFAYANGNPVSYTDPFGLSAERTGDAIWLQYRDLARGAGHTGLLLQDSDGYWYLFSWGTTRPNKALTGADTPVIDSKQVFQKLGKYNFDLNNLYDDVTQYLSSTKENKNLSQGLTGVIYFEGDFTKSIEYIESLVKTLSTNNEQYNLYDNNCLQVSMEALDKGTFDKYDEQYKHALSYASATTIPNSAYAGMKTFVTLIDDYMQKNWFLQFFAVSPYSGFSIHPDPYDEEAYFWAE